MVAARWLWSQRQDIGPSPRVGHAITYDSIRERTTLFGGQPSFESPTIFEDTWQWNGRLWTQVARFGPPQRAFHTLEFDSVRQCCVLFGGQGTVEFGDTWTFDGTYWTQVEDVGPAARLQHATAFDSTRGRLVLFGGFRGTDGSVLGDTWEWDGTAWTQTEETGPPPRAAAAMTYDPGSAATVLFGGQLIASGAGDKPASDTWLWDGTTWTQVADTGPGPRSGATLTSFISGPTGHASATLFGGAGPSGPQGDTWRWVLSGWTKIHDIGPAPRFLAATTFDTKGNQIVLFGGADANSTFADTWEAFETFR
jgi:galactose oxidase-like protein